MKSCARMAALSILAIGIAAPAQANFLANGDFSGGLSNWNIWVERDDFSGNTGQFEVDIPGAGDVRIRGWSFNGGIYQVVPVPIGVPLTIDGTWRTPGAIPASTWGEVIVLEGNNPPVNGVDVPGPVIYKNDTWTTASGWDGVISSTAPVTNNPTGGPLGAGSTTGFVTVILKAGSAYVENQNKVVRFDDMVLTPEPTTVALLAIGSGLLISRRRRHA